MSEIDHSANPKKLQEFLNAEGNIIDLLDDEQKSMIGADVVSEYEADYHHPRLAKKRENWKRGQKLVRQEMEDKNYPFDNAANITYPLLTTAAVQFQSRAYPEIVQGNTVARPKILGDAIRKEKLERAENVCEFINWQLFNEIDEWEPETDRMLGQLPLYGTMM